jgi:signal transduction histidine kinase/ActR/RegA family two-component response regulator
LVHSDGAEVTVRYAVKRLEPAGEHMVCLVDITGKEPSAAALRSLEAQLEQAQALEATGRLAGGVAHDFNNLMAVVLGYCDLLLMDFGPATTEHATVLEIRHAGERAAELTRQLLAFSRRQVLQPRIVELGATLAKMDRFARRIVGENIAVNLQVQPERSAIEIDPGQLEQIMMSLLANARDAMPDGGSVSIELCKVELSPHACDAHPGLRPGTHVRLKISDSGCGMDEATRAQVFNPYFTTKPRGRRSSGLGMSAVLGIVQQSGGHIAVESQLGVGTTFSLFFRSADAPVASAGSLELSRAGGGERILLVEDEVPVRVLTRKLLENLGYTVFEAGTAAEALEFCRSHSGGIHLLLTDLMMPNCNGTELASCVLPLRPDIKILFMSGYTDDILGDHGVIGPGTHFLQKPFTSQRLGLMVREALQDGERAAARSST